MRIVLTTQRLILREMGPDDLDFVAAMLAHVEVMRCWPRPHTREEAIAWIAKQQTRYEKDGCGYWLLVDKAKGSPVGQAGILMMEIEGQIEAGLGYIVHFPCWRRGYAEEAARACLDYVFIERKQSRVIALIRPENLPSIALATKLGLKPGKSILYAELKHIVYAISRFVD